MNSIEESMEQLELKHSITEEKTRQTQSQLILYGQLVEKLEIMTRKQFGELMKRIEKLEYELAESKKERENILQEVKDTETARKALRNTLSYKDICAKLDIPYLNETSFKYYLYELGLLEMKINKKNNTYKISENFDLIQHEIKQYAHIVGRVLIFDNQIISFLQLHFQDVKESAMKYYKKLKQFNDSKERLSSFEITNYQNEINMICGTTSKGTYQGRRYGEIYAMYKKYRPNFDEGYEKWREEYLKAHKYASMLTYIVSMLGDGDILLRIACELFVN